MSMIDGLRIEMTSLWNGLECKDLERKRFIKWVNSYLEKSSKKYK